MLADIAVPQEGRELCQHLDEDSGHPQHIVHYLRPFLFSNIAFIQFYSCFLNFIPCSSTGLLVDLGLFFNLHTSVSTSV